MKTTSVSDLEDLMVSVKALCPTSESISTKVKEDSNFVVQFYQLVHSFFIYFHLHTKIDNEKIILEDDKKNELVTLIEELDTFLKDNYFRGNSSETWVKSIVLLYGTASYYKALFSLNNTIFGFDLATAIENLEMTIYEHADYESILYLDKNFNHFQDLKQKRKRR